MPVLENDYVHVNDLGMFFRGLKLNDVDTLPYDA